MNPSIVLARNLGLLVAAGVLGVGAYRYVVLFGHLNPFDHLQKRASPLDSKTAIRLKNVDLRAYNAGKLVTSAKIGVVDVSRDRTSFDLKGIKDGAYIAPDGTIRYAADKGNWNSMLQKLSVVGGARVKGDKFDVLAPMATIDQSSEILTVPQPLGGTLYGGNMSASAFTYNIRSGDGKASRIRWQGKVDPQQAGAPVEDKPRVWNCSGEWHRNAGTDFFENATATDDEVLVIAPHIQRDIKTDVLTATGRVTYFSGKADLVADKAVIYRKEHRAVFTGNVLMLVKPKKDQDQKPKVEEIPPISPIPSVSSGKPSKSKVAAGSKQADSDEVLTDEQKKKNDELRSGKTLREYPLQVAADEITYWYQKGSRHAIFSGTPCQSRQDLTDGRWRAGNATSGTYDGEKDQMELIGTEGRRDVHFVTSLGDDIYSTLFTCSTKEDLPDDEQDMFAKDAKGQFADLGETDELRGKKKDDAGKSGTTPPKKTGGGS